MQIAKPSRATVTVMYVISPLSKSSFYSVTNTQRNLARQKAIEILDKAAGRAKIANVKFQAKLVNGITATTITKISY